MNTPKTPQTRTANDNYALYETDREAKRKTQPASAQPYLAWRKISDAPENYSLWTRNDEDGKAIYQCARQMPGPSEGGYYNAESAFKVKGLKPTPTTPAQTWQADADGTLWINGSPYHIGEYAGLIAAAQADLLRQRDELLAACKQARKFIAKLERMNVVDPNSNSGLEWDTRFALEAAIANAEKGITNEQH